MLQQSIKKGLQNTANTSIILCIIQQNRINSRGEIEKKNVFHTYTLKIDCNSPDDFVSRAKNDQLGTIVRIDTGLMISVLQENFIV